MKNIGELMQKAQQVQTQVNILQTKMARQEFTGAAANGAVSVTLTGRGEATKVKVDASVVNPQDIETLEDLILVAINNAREAVEDANAKAFEGIKKNLDLPDNFELPF